MSYDITELGGYDPFSNDDSENVCDEVKIPVLRVKQFTGSFFSVQLL